MLLEAPKGLNNMIFVGTMVIFCDYLFNLISKKFGLRRPRKKKGKRVRNAGGSNRGPQRVAGEAHNAWAYGCTAAGTRGRGELGRGRAGSGARGHATHG